MFAMLRHPVAVPGDDSQQAVVPAGQQAASQLLLAFPLDAQGAAAAHSAGLPVYAGTQRLAGAGLR